MTLVEPPRLGDGDPVLFGHVEGHVAGKRGSLENAGKGQVNFNAVFVQETTGCPRFDFAALGEGHVAPTRISILQIPFGLAMTQQNQSIERFFAKLSQRKGWRPGVRGDAPIKQVYGLSRGFLGSVRGCGRWLLSFRLGKRTRRFLDDYRFGSFWCVIALDVRG